MIAQILKTRAPFCTNANRYSAISTAINGYDGKQINAPLTLGDAVEDKDYQNDQPREQLYPELVAGKQSSLLHRNSRVSPSGRQRMFFHFKPNKEITRPTSRESSQIKVRNYTI